MIGTFGDADLGCLYFRAVVRFFLQACRNRNQFLIDRPVHGDGVGQGNRDDFVAAQRHHLAELSLVHHVDGADSIARPENAVECRRRAAALRMAQHHGAGFKFGALLDLLRKHLSNAAQALVAEFILAEILHDQRASLVDFVGEFRAFGDDHDAEVASARVPPFECLGRLHRYRRAFRV